MNRIQSKDHKIGTYEIHKISLPCFDDIIYIQNNGYDGLEKSSCLENIYLSKKLFVIHIVLIFSLIKTAFLSSILKSKNARHLKK